MLNIINNKIDRYARSYERSVLEGTDETHLGFERWGKLLGLCMAKAEIVGDGQNYMEIAVSALAKARGDIKLKP